MNNSGLSLEDVIYVVDHVRSKHPDKLGSMSKYTWGNKYQFWHPLEGISVVEFPYSLPFFRTWFNDGETLKNTNYHFKEARISTLDFIHRYDMSSAIFKDNAALNKYLSMYGIDLKEDSNSVQLEKRVTLNNAPVDSFFKGMRLCNLAGGLPGVSIKAEEPVDESLYRKQLLEGSIESVLLLSEFVAETNAKMQGSEENATAVTEAVAHELGLSD